VIALRTEAVFHSLNGFTQSSWQLVDTLAGTSRSVPAARSSATVDCLEYSFHKDALVFNRRLLVTVVDASVLEVVDACGTQPLTTVGEYCSRLQVHAPTVNRVLKTVLTDHRYISIGSVVLEVLLLKHRLASMTLVRCIIGYFILNFVFNVDRFDIAGHGGVAYLVDRGFAGGTLVLGVFDPFENAWSTELVRTIVELGHVVGAHHLHADHTVCQHHCHLLLLLTLLLRVYLHLIINF